MLDQTILFNQRLKPKHAQEQELAVDAIVGRTGFEVLMATRDAHRLRSVLLSMARKASAEDLDNIVLVLHEPHLTDQRIFDEWKGAQAVLRSDILNRMSLYIKKSGEWSGLPASPEISEYEMLDEIIRYEYSHTSSGRGKGFDSFYEILRILIYNLLMGKGPVAINSLIELSGNSYPTVSEALQRLDYCLHRHSNRSVELQYFPREEWARLIVLSDSVRATARFIDNSGLPRSPESLLRRLEKLNRSDIAVGGVWGAKHYYPSLDLVGNPRLDLSLHTQGKSIDFSFVKKLDPGLKETTERNYTPVLVVHAIRRSASLFDSHGDAVPYADPVECLLDLHEARLESQALEFLNNFLTQKGASKKTA